MIKKIFTSVFALFLIIGVFGQKATIELTFTGQNNQTYIKLDSIWVVNQTQPSDTVLYENDTVLVLEYINPGINEINGTGEQLQVFQNYPNPAKDQTSIRMFVPEKDKVGIVLTDILGRMIFSREMTLERGYHTFSYSPGGCEVCFFSAFWQGNYSSIKILTAGTGTGQNAKLEYTGYKLVVPDTKHQKSPQYFQWGPGDALKYTAYASIDNTIIASDIEFDAPIINTTYIFDILKGERCSGDDPMVYDIDGNVYLSLKIGSQCWMADNLKTTKFNDGTEIPHITDNTEWENLIGPAYCWYDNSILYKDPYGALYNWHTVDEGNLCPTGWHVPSDNEWTILTDYLVSSVGNKLKEKGTAHWNSLTGATNEVGFTGIGTGSRGAVLSLFLFMNEYGYYWSSTLDFATNNAWYRSLKHNISGFSRFPADKRSGFAVRCIKDY